MILTLQQLLFLCLNGASMYFRKGGKQDGKLWSVTRFNPDNIPAMLAHPSVGVITYFNQNPDSN